MNELLVNNYCKLLDDEKANLVPLPNFEQFDNIWMILVTASRILILTRTLRSLISF